MLEPFQAACGQTIILVENYLVYLYTGIKYQSQSEQSIVSVHMVDPSDVALRPTAIVVHLSSPRTFKSLLADNNKVLALVTSCNSTARSDKKTAFIIAARTVEH